MLSGVKPQQLRYDPALPALPMPRCCRPEMGLKYETGNCLDLKADNEIVSSLPLQMSLYFNVYFFPFWWLSTVVMLHLKYPVLSDYYKFILVTIMILASLIEVIRLYLGYMGNLQEKVPELAGFWLLSLLLQLPIILFLLFNEGLKIQPLERAVHIVFAFFLTFQVIAAFVTLKRMVNKLAIRFRLNEFDQLEEHPMPDFYSLGKEERAVSMAGRGPSAGWRSHLRA
ncbi:transmembrane protein 17 isoform X1 [Harpia harpyja]|uniref:transmembrane protein 17 isoform X1 n=1 Tax=Harpia harpyja TaxID=202280 RepID=UPI0022B0DE30|nr:transmembrane protein 17 isoform X1 [Harpia harpyja]